MANNQTKLDYIFETTTPGKEKFKHDGELYSQAKWANINAETGKKGVEDLNSRLHPGTSGVRHEGDLYGKIRRTEENTAVIQNLVKALANVSGGEKFDQEKLLAGIGKTVFDNAKAGAEAGTTAAIDGIDATVTIKQEAAK